MFPVITSDAFCLPGFRSYGNLENKGATIVWGDFSEGVGKLIPAGESFDYVFDNYAKDVDTCKDLAACAQAWYACGFDFLAIFCCQRPTGTSEALLVVVCKQNCLCSTLLPPRNRLGDRRKLAERVRPCTAVCM